MLQEITNGRTDLVFEYLAAGHAAETTDDDGVSLLQWCAYYGDVSAMRFLLSQGAKLESLGDDYQLNAASYHGHWRLCRFLLDRGADVNQAQADTGETPLHSATSKPDRWYNVVVKTLLAAGANPNAKTIAGVETGAFMRDCRTKGETPLHRAAAFGDEEMIEMLLQAGGRREVVDAHGDTPLSWASWYGRPASVLRLLCYGRFRVRPGYRSMAENLRGTPVD